MQQDSNQWETVRTGRLTEWGVYREVPVAKEKGDGMVGDVLTGAVGKVVDIVLHQW
jgi:hypothetical protein